LAKRSGCKRVLFISSGAVYGPQPPEISHVTEDYLGSPHLYHQGSAYGEAKRMAEVLCAIYSRRYGVDTVAARCFAFVGPYLNLRIHFAVGNFIRDGLEGKPITVKGDGTPLRSYLYAADLTVWLWTLLTKGRPGTAYNVGSEDAVSIADLASRVAKCFESREVRILGVRKTETPVEQYVPSTHKARSELNLNQWVDLDTAISRTVEWHRSAAKHIEPTLGGLTEGKV
jgi:nucleoside-diphosphate-sugar epimerase